MSEFPGPAAPSRFISEKQLEHERGPNQNPIKKREEGGGDWRPLKEVLDDNRKKAEEQWEDEHKYLGPRPLDDDEVAFLTSKEDEERLRMIEKQLEDLQEVQQFQSEVKKLVYELPKQQTPNDTKKQEPQQITKKRTADIKQPTIRIVAQKKRKTEGENDEQDTEKKPTKPNSKTGGSALLGLVDYGDDD